MSTDVQYEREVAELRRDTRAADAAARREEKRQRREAKAESAASRATAARERRSARRSALLAFGRWMRPVLPLLIVTGFAVYGQVSYGLEAYSPPEWPLAWRLLVAIGAALGIESIALYVSWHAHDALLMDATATAARMRRASYLIAFGVAGLIYVHFSNHGAPTPAAVTFALFSASTPWLWGLHTRRQHHIQLLREGQADATGAVFSAERWRAFPIRTFFARRWSIDHGVADPRVAWTGFNAERSAKEVVDAEQKAVDRRALTKDATDAEIIADLQAWAVDRAATGRPRPTQNDARKAYPFGSPKIRRIFLTLGWFDRSTGPDRRTVEAVS